MLTFTPLLGAQSASKASQSLLELDGGVKVLVDVGWDSSFNVEQLHALEQQLSTISIILLTHPTLEHIGAFAYCRKYLPLFSRIPVYATTPVINLGRTALIDLYASSTLAATPVPGAPSEDGQNSTALLLPAPTADEIAGYFASILPLKYSQPHQPLPSPLTSASLSGLTITAYNAGHTLGGTIWHIQHGLESIVYAVDWNQGRENLLAGAAWLGSGRGGAEIIEPLRRPTALICSSRGVERTNPLPYRRRDEALVSLIRETIAQGGKVLIPTDSSARALELGYILNNIWRDNVNGPHGDTYKNARVYWASKSCKTSVRFLQSMLEWLDEGVRGEAEAAMTKGKGQGNLSNPLDWRHVKLLEKQSHLERILARTKPGVILASDASLQWGFSRLALELMGSDSRNLVILPEAFTNETEFAGQLWNQYAAKLSHASGHSGAQVVTLDGASFEIPDTHNASLTPDDNAIYQSYVARQRQLQSNLQGDGGEGAIGADAAADLADDADGSDSSDSDDDDADAEHQGRALNISAQMTQSTKRKGAPGATAGLSDAELGVNVLLRSKTLHDYDVRNKRGREKMFPFTVHRTRDDEYGDLIKPEQYLRAEEREDTDGVDMRAGDSADQQSNAVGHKRKWGDVATNAPGQNRRNSKGSNKRTKSGRGDRDNDDAPGENGIDGGHEQGERSDDSEESDYEPEEDVDVHAPRKVTYTSSQLTLSIRVAHIDFTGLHEKRDLQMLIPLIRPRKLLLVAGTASETQTLASECRQLLGVGEGDAAAGEVVFCPTVGETIDASVDTNAWTLKLSAQLVKKLTWQNVKGLGVVALTGLLEAPETATGTEAAVSQESDEIASQATKKPKLEASPRPKASEVAKSQSAAETALPILDLMPTAPLANQQFHQHAPTNPVHVGDLRLADLRRLMSDTGHTAEFRGEGTLLIDGTVVVRKSASGKIELEAGPGALGMPQWRTLDPSPVGSFYAVRRAVYAGLAVVAGV